MSRDLRAVKSLSDAAWVDENGELSPVPIYFYYPRARKIVDRFREAHPQRTVVLERRPKARTKKV